jgi:hypothetical protein
MKPIIKAPDPRHNKIGPVSTDRNIAQVASPAATTGQSQMRIKASTYFTVPGDAQILYDGSRIWVRVTITLRTAGPVVVGETAQIVPVTSGQGILLVTNQPVVFDLAKSNKLFIAANGLNRVEYLVQPLPWLEEITGTLSTAAGTVR